MAVHMGGTHKWPSKATEYVSNKGASLGKWLMASMLFAAFSALCSIFAFPTIAAASALLSGTLAITGVISTFPLISTAFGTVIVFKKRHAVIILLMAMALFTAFAWRISWKESFSFAVSVTFCYWAFVLASLYKDKSATIWIFMIALLAYVIYGAILLLDTQQAQIMNNVERYITNYPDAIFSIVVSAVAAIWIYTIFRRNVQSGKMSKKDAHKVEEKHRDRERMSRELAAHRIRMDKLRQENPDKWLEEYVKGKDLDLDPWADEEDEEIDPRQIFTTSFKAAAVFWLAAVVIGARLLFF